MSASSKDGLLAVTGTFIGLSTASVALRFFARKKQRLPLKADDVFAAAALVFYVAAAAAVFALIHYKFVGYATADLTSIDIAAHLKPKLVTAILWNTLLAFCFGCIKLSAIYFYRRIFCIPGLRRPIDYLTSATAVICALWVLTFTIFPWFQCGRDISVLWNTAATTECKHESSYYLSLVISNWILDLWILILPIANIFHLKVSTAKKVSILGVFCLACLGLGASTAKMVIYLEINIDGPVYFVTHDYGRASTKVSYLNMLEAGISIVAVNLPSLWFLITKTVPEKALRSIRSVLSLRSTRSDRSTSHNRDIQVSKDVQLSTSPVNSTTSLNMHPMPAVPSRDYR